MAKKLVAKRTASAPGSVSIRMYNVGFGDCFLLTFHYPQQKRHMLIDFGSTAAPEGQPKDYMQRVAADIKAQCGSKLDIVVVTHRHRDHISGFATDGNGTGKTIAGLKPDFIVQPWTEDPDAKPDALTATVNVGAKGGPSAKQMKAHYLGSLEAMHRVAAGVATWARQNAAVTDSATADQLSFLGEDNLKNLSAVKNLMAMGRAGTPYYVNAGMQLNGLLPGVKITVLGPPDLKQSDKIRVERVKDPAEFWQFRNFWAAQHAAVATAVSSRPRKLFSRRVSTTRRPNVRWFIREARKIQASQMLALVRELDDVMNNTSVILLLEIGTKKLLFPGDAQIENWAFALQNPAWMALLRDVDLYKVGHHGSLNATPKTLWAGFKHKSEHADQGRIETLCSTKAGSHGNEDAGTEVPRRLLVDELKKESDFTSTEDYKSPDGLVREFTITV
jgi:beta-lactamase superfamily II metal-dependent hydrolase